MKPGQALSLYDMRDSARRRLPKMIFDYIEGGAEDETCCARNRAALDALEILPRYLRDVSAVSQEVELFGRRWASPFGIAPMGMTGITWKDADLVMAQAAHEARIPFILSGAASGSTERVAKVAPSAWYQLYIPRDPVIRRDLISRASDSGLETLVVTIDVPVYSKRERDIKNGWVRPYKPSLTSRIEALRHPSWLAGFLKNGIPYLENWQKYAEPGDKPIDVAMVYATQSFAVQTWDLLGEIREQWKGNLVLKGVLHPEDAALAVTAGADGIIVSNHGGRQFDRAPAPATAFPAVHAAVAGRIPVMIDSAIMRGSDVVATMCLGSSFAFIGRGALYSVGAFGRPGVDRAIAILQEEITLALKTIGSPEVAGLGPQYLAQTA